MKTKFLFPLCFIILHSSFCLSLRAQGTAFTYQGRLSDNGSPANGLYSLRFRLLQTNNGAPQGPVLTNNAVAVSNGLFTTTLDFGDYFGTREFALEIGVRSNGSAVDFTVLTPINAIRPTPVAIAANHAALAVSVVSVPDGALSANIPRLDGSAAFTGPMSFSNAIGTFNGAFTGNGAGVTNLDLTVNSGGAINLNGFVHASSLSVESYPISVTAADVNGDGKVDLIGAISGVVGSLAVLTNNGSGGFVLASSPGVGSYPKSVTAADVNGDGKVDLISANAGPCCPNPPGTLTVLTNNGSGGFVLASSPSVGNAPHGVAAADVNGDGKVDLISANFGDNTLTVLTNNGGGGFVLASSLNVDAGPLQVAAADVNGDGKVDLISANQNGNTLSVLINNGSGGFTWTFTALLDNSPQSVAAADVNGDGKVDLISANFGNDTLTVLTNTGSGGFQFASSPGVGSHPRSVVAADVNGDGKLDLISANGFTNTLSVLINNGSGHFTLVSSPVVGSAPFSVAVADVNGDGRVDLISADAGADTLTVLFNTAASFTGHGAGLTSLNAANVSSGTLADARLSANVALRGGGNAFTGNQTIAGNATVNGVVNAASDVTEAFVVSGAAAGYELHDRNTGAAGRWVMYAQGGSLGFYGAGATRMTVSPAGAVAAFSFNPSSDRNVKQDFCEVNSRAVLEKVAQLPIQTWTFKNDPHIKHVGPMAQDFHAAFGLGTDDRHIATVDADGVALAAIQGLNQKMDSENATLRAENAELKQRLEALEKIIHNQKSNSESSHRNLVKTLENQPFLRLPFPVGRSVSLKTHSDVRNANKIKGFEHVSYGTALNQIKGTQS